MPSAVVVGPVAMHATRRTHRTHTLKQLIVWHAQAAQRCARTCVRVRFPFETLTTTTTPRTTSTKKRAHKIRARAHGENRTRALAMCTCEHTLADDVVRVLCLCVYACAPRGLWRSLQECLGAANEDEARKRTASAMACCMCLCVCAGW